MTYICNSLSGMQARIWTDIDLNAPFFNSINIVIYLYKKWIGRNCYIYIKNMNNNLECSIDVSIL